MLEPVPLPLRLAFVRPLVRYVDEDQAVIDAQFALRPPLPTAAALPVAPAAVEVLVEMRGADSFIDEQRLRVPLHDLGGTFRYQVVHPLRWWPAGMGAQALYEWRVSLLAGDRIADTWTSTVGLTSVRLARASGQASRGRPELLVNGQECDIRAVVPIDQPHERGLLPVSGTMLLVVRGHYGPDVLYDAADRAGLLLVQCVPIDPAGEPEAHMAAEVNRLGAHPSLAGWFVGHLGGMMERTASRLRSLDPSRGVFVDIPGLS